MDYREAVERLQSLQQRRPKLGVDTTARMLSFLGDPHESIDCVQIAGSNGKGSTARLLESVLQTTGLTVGSYLSPALNGFRGQIRVNDRPIPKSRVTTFVERIEPCLDALAADDDMPTKFEVLTALALFQFAKEDVDVAVLEVGIGGRYDATSAVDPVASAVTSVSLEHTELLGDTVEEIARDKAHVAPTNRPLVTAVTGRALAAIRSQTDVITVGGDDCDVVAHETGMRMPIENNISLRGPAWAVDTHLTLLGEHQATNAAIAATLARQVADADEPSIATGLRRATLAGRFEIRSTEPMIALDGAHNPGATERLTDLLSRYTYDNLHVVFGVMTDKDHERMIESLPAVETAFATRPAVDRATDSATVAGAFASHAQSVREIASVPEATERAIAAAEDDDFVLVTGSLYAVSEARDRWTRLVVPTDRRPAARESGGYGGVTDGASASHAGTVESSRSAASSTADSPVAALTPTTLAVSLRPPQAELVGERVRALGGACVSDPGGAPGDLVETTLSGTLGQFRELIEELRDIGAGLGRLAAQLERTLTAPSNPFGTDGPAVMGILNVTPDSFYDGGEYDRLDAAVDRAEAMVDHGADIIDIGGESTRPGAEPVPVETEIERVVPVIEAISALDVPVSIDTRKAAVADAALAAGATIVNDVSGLSDPDMRFVVADHDASVVIMHSLSAPVDPDRTVRADDVVGAVREDLIERLLVAEQAGIDRENIIVDPGCGFGKTASASFELVDRLHELSAFGCPILLGHSRKSMFRSVSSSPDDRLVPTVAATALAAERGADIVRVHDVADNAAAVRTTAATNGWTPLEHD